MSSSLAIRYRPKSLSEVVGQPRAVTTIKGLVEKRNTSRGILFSGPTGVGKTSLARIAAHALNCEGYNTKTHETCGKCAYCESVASGTYPDLVELNFSETRGIETIRGIIDSLQYEPTTPTRVVILDEMQNMTPQAAHAFLKPLEEPPPNTLFILITTERHKIMPQILNRCLPVEFSKIGPDVLFTHLQGICEKEKHIVHPYGLKYISINAGGILRQAITLLERVFMSPDMDTSNQKELELLVGDKETRTSSFAEFLLSGVYACKYSASLSFLQNFLKDPTVDIRQFFNKCYEHHLQTFHLIIDPTKKQESLFSDTYNDWYASLIEALGSKKCFIVLSSAEKILDELFRLTEALKSYDADIERLTTAYTVKMVRHVLDSRAEAYTKNSPIHRKYAAEHLEDK